MRRGGIVTVAMPGDFGKPHPVLVVQSDQFEATGTVTILLISATLVGAPLLRISVQPTQKNGLLKPSQIMVDKAMSVKRERIGPSFDRLEDDVLVAVNRALALFFSLGGSEAKLRARPASLGWRFGLTGSMAATDQLNGIAEVGGLPFQGFAVWLVWRAYDLMQMPTFSRKLRIVFESPGHRTRWTRHSDIRSE